MATIEPWLEVTPAQLKSGWIELRGVTPVHHNFLVIRKLDDGNYCVRNPKSQMAEAGESED